MAFPTREEMRAERFRIFRFRDGLSTYWTGSRWDENKDLAKRYETVLSAVQAWRGMGIVRSPDERFAIEGPAGGIKALRGGGTLRVQTRIEEEDRRRRRDIALATLPEGARNHIRSMT